MRGRGEGCCKSCPSPGGHGFSAGGRCRNECKVTCSRIAWARLLVLDALEVSGPGQVSTHGVWGLPALWFDPRVGAEVFPGELSP